MHRRTIPLFALLPILLLILAGCAGPHRRPPLEFGPAPAPGEVVKAGTQTGQASYYAHKFHGRTTASGAPYDMNALTAAHRTLPFGTRVRVTNLHNGRDVELEITDRGPFVKGRIIDVSWQAAHELGFVNEGVVPVRVDVLALGK